MAGPDDLQAVFQSLSADKAGVLSCVSDATHRDKRYHARGLTLEVARQRLVAALKGP